VDRIFERAAAAFRETLVRVRPNQLGNPTPCEPLDVAHLIEKAIGHQDWVRGALEGQQVPAEYPSIDPADYLTELDRSTTAFGRKLDRAGAMDRQVTLAASLTFSGEEVMLLASRNIFQFAWDLARGTEQSSDLAPDVASELLEISRTRLVPQRGPGGFFGPEHVPPDGAPVADVLAGFLGRPVAMP
jgi:uncharacterized protein (TIGR03086 family)